MILLFGDKATKSSASKKNSNINSHPVENSGILAMNLSEAKSLLTVGEYDTYVFSNPYAVDYSMYSDCSYDTSSDTGFMSSFSSAVAMLGDSGFGGGYSCAGAGSFSSGASCGASCSSFSSVG